MEVTTVERRNPMSVDARKPDSQVGWRVHLERASSEAIEAVQRRSGAGRHGEMMARPCDTPAGTGTGTGTGNGTGTGTTGAPTCESQRQRRPSEPPVTSEVRSVCD